MVTWFYGSPWLAIASIYLGVGAMFGTLFVADEAENMDSDGWQMTRCFFYWLLCWGWAISQIWILDPLKHWWKSQEDSSDSELPVDSQLNGRR